MQLDPIPADSALTDFPLLDEESIPSSKRTEFHRRLKALYAVNEGMSVNASAIFFGVNRGTLTRTVRLSMDMHADGRPWGLRACIPHLRKTPKAPENVAIPVSATPRAMERILFAQPDIRAYVEQYRGPLPTRQHISTKFDRFFDGFKKRLRAAGLEYAYPLNTPHEGRRALRLYIARQRNQILEAGGGSGEDAMPSLTRMDQILGLRPLERIELDAHHIDVKSYIEVFTAKREVVLRPVKKIWIIVMLDVASRAILGWLLEYGDSYKRFGILRLFAKTLIPWKRRDLYVADMQYEAVAWMPSELPSLPRPLGIAFDNARAHHANDVRDAFDRSMHGYIHAGPSHCPQVRAHIEAFFKTTETEIIRFIAGGFKPGTNGQKPIKVSTKQEKEHPIDPRALDDLMDVAITLYNGTGHSGLQNRSPKQVLETHLNSGGWFFTSSQTRDDAEKMLIVRTTVTVRSNKKDGKPPHVRWKGARYRSTNLMRRWDLSGRKFKATVRFSDARVMRLYDETTGELFVTLEALPPWSASPHTIEDRERALISLEKTGELRDGAADAIEAYNKHTLKRVLDNEIGANQYIRLGMSAPPLCELPDGQTTQEPSTYTPATGWVSFSRKRDRT
jgi:hypothetical protein